MLLQKLDKLFFISLTTSILIHVFVVLLFNGNENQTNINQQIQNNVEQHFVVSLDNIIETPNNNSVKHTKQIKVNNTLTISSTKKPLWIAEIEDFIFTYGSIEQVEEETRLYSCKRENNYTMYGT